MSLSINSVGVHNSVYTTQSITGNSETASAGYVINDTATFSSQQACDPTENLNGLYSQKADAENRLNDIKSQSDSNQSQINIRKGEINQEHQGDGGSDELNSVYQEAQAEYQEASAAKNEAQQQVSQLNQEKSQNSQAIASNAQQTQQVSSDLSAAQNE